MQALWKLWLAIVVLGVVLGFIFWAEVGYDSTIVIYDEGEELGERAEAPRIAAAEETVPVPVAEAPVWLTTLEWTAIGIGACSFLYIVYLGSSYWRRRRSY